MTNGPSKTKTAHTSKGAKAQDWGEDDELARKQGYRNADHGYEEMANELGAQWSHEAKEWAKATRNENKPMK